MTRRTAKTREHFLVASPVAIRYGESPADQARGVSGKRGSKTDRWLAVCTSGSSPAAGSPQCVPEILQRSLVTAGLMK
jgi:hypothetical protein